VDLLDLAVDDLLDVLTSYRIDDHVPTATSQPSGEKGEWHTYSRAHVKREMGSANPPSIDEQDPETWGTAPEQVAAQQRLMASIGPPAPPRVDPAP
jgi:hypothetical protein